MVKTLDATQDIEVAGILGLSPEELDEMTEAEVTKALGMLSQQDAPGIVA